MAKRKYLTFEQIQERKTRQRVNYPDYGDKWQCPECGCTDFKCVNTDPVKENGISRTRVCTKCGKTKFYTFEKIVKASKV